MMGGREAEWTCSSVEERYLDTIDAEGSIPFTSTTEHQLGTWWS